MEPQRTHLSPEQWIALCAERLREHWPRADRTSLQEAAEELWEDQALRELMPTQAAATWLQRGFAFDSA